MSRVIEPDECDCSGHDDPVNTPCIHNMPCCDGPCDVCYRPIKSGMTDSHMRDKHPPAPATEDEAREKHIRHLADSHCRNKHQDYYNSLICIGPGSARFGPPCDGCIEEVRQRLKDKAATVHGRRLTPEEAAAYRKELGID